MPKLKEPTEEGFYWIQQSGPHAEWIEWTIAENGGGYWTLLGSDELLGWEDLNAVDFKGPLSHPGMEE